MINISNFRSEDNPRWPQGGAAGRLMPAGPPAAARVAGRSTGARTGDAEARIRDTWTRIRDTWTRIRDTWTRIWSAVTVIAWVFAGWVSGIPRRWLDRLFEKNDAEAYWRGWQIARVHGGFGRRYRDPRFDTLAECSRCGGAGTRAGEPCSPCFGTGRVEIDGTGRMPTDATGRVPAEADWLTGEVS